MGLKSVQVRAGAGMKVVDGTLQRAPSTSSRVAKASGTSRGNRSPGSAAASAAAARTWTPEFVRVRPSLYMAAWAAMMDASRFDVDESGDVAPGFVQAREGGCIYTEPIHFFCSLPFKNNCIQQLRTISSYCRFFWVVYPKSNPLVWRIFVSGYGWIRLNARSFVSLPV